MAQFLSTHQRTFFTSASSTASSAAFAATERTRSRMLPMSAVSPGNLLQGLKGNSVRAERGTSRLQKGQQHLPACRHLGLQHLQSHEAHPLSGFDNLYVNSSTLTTASYLPTLSELLNHTLPTATTDRNRQSFFICLVPTTRKAALRGNASDGHAALHCS